MNSNPSMAARLAVPERHPASDGSFPTTTQGVIDWLGALDVEARVADRGTLLQGLRHANRLEIPTQTRREMLLLFQPHVETLYPLLAASSREQPLPLAQEFRRDNELLSNLQREMAYLAKGLVLDSMDAPDAADHAEALKALARGAEAARLAYRQVPGELLREAHALFQHAEQAQLLRVPEHGPAIGRCYRYLVLLAQVDLQQIRNRQLPLVLRYLDENARRINVTMRPQARAIRSTDFAVDLNHGERLAPASSLLPGPDDALCWIDFRPLVMQLNQDIRVTRTTYSSLMHSDAMERQTLVRLHAATGRERERRQQRGIVNAPKPVVIGLKAIHAALDLGASEQDENTVLNARDIHADNPGWVVLNESLQGLCLDNDACPAGEVQVGELVLSLPTHASGNDVLDEAVLSVVRWLHCHESHHVRIGVEHLARGVLPVAVRAGTTAALPGEEEALDAPSTVTDDAIIIACRIQGQPTQTILLPAFRFQAGDVIEARLNARLSRIKLRQCLQANELFSHFALSEI